MLRRRGGKRRKGCVTVSKLGAGEKRKRSLAVVRHGTRRKKNRNRKEGEKRRSPLLT